jgi:hypothetical protein
MAKSFINGNSETSKRSSANKTYEIMNSLDNLLIGSFFTGIKAEEAKFTEEGFLIANEFVNIEFGMENLDIQSIVSPKKN